MCQFIWARIQSEHKYQLVSAVDSNNKTCLGFSSCVNKEDIILKRQYLLIQIRVCIEWLGYCDLTPENVKSRLTYCSYQHIGAALDHPVHSLVQSCYSKLRSNCREFLLPRYRACIIDHEQMSTSRWQNDMRWVKNVSVSDNVVIAENSWTEKGEVSGVY